ncbi:unnamed protein product, partial [Mesorhabditis spiculigera]
MPACGQPKTPRWSSFDKEIELHSEALQLQTQRMTKALAGTSPGLMPDADDPLAVQELPDIVQERPEISSECDVFQLPAGMMIADRWRIIEKLGEGSGGAIYRVCDHVTHAQRAVKVEPKGDKGQSLKLEYSVLEELRKNGASNVMEILLGGKVAGFRFLIIQLLERDLYSLKRSLSPPITEGSMLKLGIMALAAIKQLHEIGYIHRDIKPGNLMLGRDSEGRSSLYLIDYGMVRTFVRKSGNSWKLRKERVEKTDFRGTLRYCSLNVHLRKEQCRADDLWAWLYTMTEVFFRLPWNKEHDELKIMRQKRTLPDSTIFMHCPREFVEIKHYLKGLGYADRPDYFQLHQFLLQGMKRNRAQFSMPFEWEADELVTALQPTPEEAAEFLPAKPDEVDYRMYPSLHPDRFKENIIGL